ncbi:hypothetical protein [uncultured Draconibacterium sp.]|uniref:hypothetical protein n=1 Tax=uncultured Draconibacterium sp. TaxID=1573823 RepID=UPI002AA765A8|nr:hypothetical protein [uncultured Draconibacterium sp.]
MKTKVLLLILFSIMMSVSVSAQFQGKKFSANLDGIGKINLEFKEEFYELSTPAAVVVVKGNYKIEEKKITFNDTEGPIACQKSVNGEYEFLYKDGVLSFKVIQDACPGRKSIASAEWKEVE